MLSSGDIGVVRPHTYSLSKRGPVLETEHHGGRGVVLQRRQGYVRIRSDFLIWTESYSPTTSRWREPTCEPRKGRALTWWPRAPSNDLALRRGLMTRRLRGTSWLKGTSVLHTVGENARQTHLFEVETRQLGARTTHTSFISCAASSYGATTESSIVALAAREVYLSPRSVHGEDEPLQRASMAYATTNEEPARCAAVAQASGLRR